MLRLLASPLTMILVVVGAGLLLVSLWGTVKRAQSSAEQVVVLDQENQKMASEVLKLQNQVAVASTSAAQEKIIRDELLLQKSGEYVVQLPPLEVTRPSPTPEPSLTPWQAWKKEVGW